MSLVSEIASDLTNPSIHLSDILRKAKVLAYQLQSDEMKSWVNLELDGYSSIPPEQIPEYRKLFTQSFGNFLGYFGSELKNAPIPPASLPKDWRNYGSDFYIRQGIRALEGLIAADDLSLDFLWSQNNVLAIQNKIYEDYKCVQAWWVINKSSLEQILDTVRNRLLSFVLEIEQQNLVVETIDKMATSSTTEKVTQVFYMHIMGGQNVIGAVSELNQIRLQIVTGDIHSLNRFLLDAGIHDDDVDELQQALEKDGPANKGDKKFGPKVKEWLGGMIQKSASGAWKISLDVATNMLTKALFQYYGWN
jgi:hypothetical protein